MTTHSQNVEPVPESGALDTDPGRTCKVGRVSRRYEVADVVDEIGTLWTRDDGRYSLRELAGYFNRRILRSAMEAAGMSPLDGEVENVYRLLTAEEISAGNRVQARNRLRERGVDVDDVESDFVSYQTINRHLKRCLGIRESPRSDGLDAEDALQRIRALQHRTTAVTRKSLGQLRKDDGIGLGACDVLVDINVVCTDCGTVVELQSVLEGEGCECL